MSDVIDQRDAERRSQALRDLEELDAQEAAGEVDAETAARLRTIYQAEAEGAEAVSPPDEGPPTRSTVRVIAGFLLFAVAAGAITFAVVKAVEPRREGGIVTGGIVSDVVEEPRSLEDISNEEMEAVVAANPEIVGMRLALARRYFEEGDLSKAFDHYFEVLQQEPDNPEALALIGWMAHLSGESDVGASYLVRALEAAPGYRDATVFLAQLRMEAGDVAGAVPLLEEMLTWDDLDAATRAQLEETLELASQS